MSNFKYSIDFMFGVDKVHDFNTDSIILALLCLFFYNPPHPYIWKRLEIR